MISAREHAHEMARRWPTWFGAQVFVAIYGVNALLDQLFELLGVAGWEMSPFVMLVGAIAGAFAATGVTRASRPTGGTGSRTA
ncbi:MAG: hypothetical protein IPJ78_17295 [Gemmatimonadetes bacterium]|nr:hypothetical protein [Gemmatimonadota bacterium]